MWDTTRDGYDTLLAALRFAAPDPAIHLEDDILLTSDWRPQGEEVIAATRRADPVLLAPQGGPDRGLPPPPRPRLPLDDLLLRPRPHCADDRLLAHWDGRRPPPQPSSTRHRRLPRDARENYWLHVPVPGPAPPVEIRSPPRTVNPPPERDLPPMTAQSDRPMARFRETWVDGRALGKHSSGGFAGRPIPHLGVVTLRGRGPEGAAGGARAGASRCSPVAPAGGRWRSLWGLCAAIWRDSAAPCAGLSRRGGRWRGGGQCALLASRAGRG